MAFGKCKHKRTEIIHAWRRVADGSERYFAIMRCKSCGNEIRRMEVAPKK